MSHTQGKLFSNGSTITSENGWPIASVHFTERVPSAGEEREPGESWLNASRRIAPEIERIKSDSDANARRLAACWNASIGIPTAELEAAADGRLLNIFEGLISERDELLEALREISTDYADRFDLDSPSTNPGIKSSIKHARAAIARAEKGGA
jgi:hypothetical protein